MGEKVCDDGNVVDGLRRNTGGTLKKDLKGFGFSFLQRF
jgi:hypothetical protein